MEVLEEPEVGVNPEVNPSPGEPRPWEPIPNQAEAQVVAEPPEPVEPINFSVEQNHDNVANSQGSHDRNADGNESDNNEEPLESSEYIAKQI